MDPDKFLSDKYAPGKKLLVGIDKLAFGGEGVGRDGQMVVFVPGALPGDMVRAEITEYKKNFVRARIDKLIARSSDRVEPRCAVADACGGCQLQYLSYPAQVKAKHEMVADQLRTIARMPEAPILPTVKCPEPFGYRIRARLRVEPAGTGYRVGFRAHQSCEIVEFPCCPVLHPALDRTVQAARQVLPETGPGLAGELEIACTPDGSAVLLRLLPESGVWAGARALFERLQQAGLPVVGVTLAGSGASQACGLAHLDIPVGRHIFRVSAGSFFQANGFLLGKLVERANLLLTPTARDIALDLYAGAGLFTLPLAEAAAETLAVESDPAAAEDLRANLKRAGLKARVLAKPAEKAFFAPPLDTRKDLTAVVLDPPRSGAHARVIQALIERRIEKLLFVSCDPPTLARDIRTLADGGFQLKAVQPLDMFPQTYHVETMAYLTHPYAKHAPDILFRGDYA